MMTHLDPGATAAHDTRLHVKGLSLAFSELKEEWRTAMTVQWQREHAPRAESRPIPKAAPVPPSAAVPRPSVIRATRVGLANHAAITGRFESW